ncbi:HAD family hydrolase [Bizionia sediminis]|uniref:HAD family hydrolase n=1 Tax=Bizionia sediminis TaxID=1737064 RepID=A0ABW5KX76_9FLAO
MITTIIFDFGDVFINLDKTGASIKALEFFNITEFSPEMMACNEAYETGKISTDAFLNFYQKLAPNATKNQLITIWNALLRDFPPHRLAFLQKLATQNNYQLILLSNTNELHIDWIKKNVSFYETFQAQFHQFYLSHIIELRKPNADIYKFVLDSNRLQPENCLFIDDTKENIEAAHALGIHTWHLNPEKHDVVNLFTAKKDLF